MQVPSSRRSSSSRRACGRAPPRQAHGRVALLQAVRFTSALTAFLRNLLTNQGGTATPSGSPPPGSPPAGSPPGGGPAPDRIQPQEIIDTLAQYAKEGITLSNLMKVFQRRINKPGNITKSEWIQMVKAHAVYGQDKLLRPKPAGGSP